MQVTGDAYNGNNDNVVCKMDVIAEIIDRFHNGCLFYDTNTITKQTELRK